MGLIIVPFAGFVYKRDWDRRKKIRELEREVRGLYGREKTDTEAEIKRLADIPWWKFWEV